MGNKKHIDRLFQEKFKDFEAKPSDTVWQNIKKELNQPKETTKPVVPLWSKYAAIAAVVLIFVTVGIKVFTNETAGTIINNEIEDTTRSTTKIDSNATNTSSSTSSSSVKENNESAKNASGSTINPLVDSTAQPITLKNFNVTNNIAPKTQSKVRDSYSSSKENKYTGDTSKGNSTNRSQHDVVANTSSLNEETKKSNKQASPLNTFNKPNALAETIATKDSPSRLQTKGQSVTKNNSNNVTATPLNKNTSVYYKPYKDNTLSVKTTDDLFNTDKKLTTLSTNNLAKGKTINETLIIDSSLDESIEDAIAKLKKLDIKETSSHKWSIHANVAPVYYSSLGKGSSIDDQFINNDKDGELNMSYGVKVGYALNDKLKLRSGVNALKLSYDTAGVLVYQSVLTGNPDIKPLRHINMDPTLTGESLSVISTENFNVQQVNNVFNDKFNAALSQRMRYIEVPLELEYAIINERFGLNIIGGMSTFFLSDNQVVTEFENYRTKIGEANNINDVSFSTNLGLGLNYNFSKTFTFNFEPTFKYKINTYSESSGNFKPYIIGVYTGFSYKF